jgi:hypothetical protein
MLNERYDGPRTIVEVHGGDRGIWVAFEGNMTFPRDLKSVFRTSLKEMRLGCCARPVSPPILGR